MIDRVIQFADYAIKATRKHRYLAPNECVHKHVQLDDNGDVVLCLDCNKQLSAYWALRTIMESWDEHAQAVKRRQDELDRKLAESLTLRAAQIVEHAWRSRALVPVCPHCRVPILPTDGFGTFTVCRDRIVRLGAASESGPR